jgi:hypothetical protein
MLSTNDDQPPSTRSREPSTPFERAAFRLFRQATIGCVGIVTGFIGYLLIGSGLHLIGLYDPGFQIMSFDDPVFTLLGFLTGAFVCLSSGLLVLLTLLLEPRDGRAEFVVLLVRVYPETDSASLS